MTATHRNVRDVARDPRLAALVAIAAGAALLGAAVVIGASSTIGLVSVGIGLALLASLASLRWPRTVTVIVILTPILDRYIIADWLPRSVELITHLLSEGMLLSVGLALTIHAWRTGRLVPALRHPTSIGFALFAVIAILSTAANAVPPEIATMGVAMTLDACACFYLPRLVGFSTRQVMAAVAVIVILVFISGLGGLGQWTLRPDLFGLRAIQGRYGEVWRLASIFSDPNTFGALLIGVIPFATFAITALRRPAYRIAGIALAILLFMPLYLSFSRGAWAGLLIGGGLALALMSWRTLAVTVAIAVVSFFLAVNAPREILLPPRTPLAALSPRPTILPNASPVATPNLESPDRPRQPSIVDSTIARLSEIWAGEDLRTLLVLNGIPIVRDHPLLGVGPGRWGGAAADIFGSPVYDEYATGELIAGSPQQRTVDNFWLHTLVETGIPGFVAFVGAGLAAGIPILRAARRATGWQRVLLGGIGAGAAAIAVNSVTTMLLEANAVAFLLWFLLGLGSVLVVQVVEEARPDVPREVLPAA